MDAKTYIDRLRTAFKNSDESAASEVAARLRGEPWPTVALVCYRTMAIARPDDAESRWLSARLSPVLLAAFEANRGVEPL